MRRKTPGVLSAEDFVEVSVRTAEADPERTIALLEPLVGQERRARLLDVIEKRIASVTVLFDAPYDPHNGAAVVRSCEAFGIQTLHVVERLPFLAAGTVSRGAQKWIDVVRHKAAHDAIAHLSAFTLVATHPDGDLEPKDLRTMERICIVLGNERDGITEALYQAAHCRIRVPMRGFSESLNVSVTGAIVMSAATEGRAGDLPEAERQRMYARGLYFSVARAKEVLSR